MFRERLFGRPALQALALATLLAPGFVACSKAIPVQELSEAQLQLDAAANEGAERYAPEQYSGAESALLAAHQNLADDNYDGARDNAIRSRDTALDARAVAAPAYAQEQKALAQQGLESADEAYAEVLAARDFAAARDLFEAGQSLEENAGQTAGQADAAPAGEARTNLRLTSLQQYSEAARKYTDSVAAADRARNLALAQKDDMLDSLDGIRGDLERAESYGAADSHAAELTAANESLARAEELIQDGRLKAGHEQMQDAQDRAEALLVQVEGDFARRRLAEAQSAVERARGDYTGVNTENNRRDPETSAVLEALGSQVGAAEEASQSADRYLSQEQYRDSINESEEAIRLAQIIFEQSNLLAGAQQRDLDVGSGASEEQVAQVLTEGWQEYTVSRANPAECLWRIAQKPQFYGNGRLWRRIYQANSDRIRNPNLIYPGQRLRIPPRQGSTDPQSATETPEESAATTEPDAQQEQQDEGMPAENVE